MKRFSLLIVCSLLIIATIYGCNAQGREFAEQSTINDSGISEWYISDGEIEYEALPDYWYMENVKLDCFIGTIKHEKIRLYADNNDPQMTLLKEKRLFEDPPLVDLIRRDLLPDRNRDTIIRVCAWSEDASAFCTVEDDNIIQALNETLQLGCVTRALNNNETYQEICTIMLYYEKAPMLFTKTCICEKNSGERYLWGFDNGYIPLPDDNTFDKLVYIAD